MPFTPIIGAAKCELLFTNVGLEGVNVLWLMGIETDDATAIADAASAVAASYQSEILPQKTAQFRLDAVRVTSWDTADGPQSTSVSDEVGGRSSAAPMAPERALLVQLRTLLRGRSTRGRIYDAGYADDQAETNGSVATESQQQVSQNWLDFRTALTTAMPGLGLAVVSLTNGTKTPVTDTTVAATVGIQRRRIRA